MDYYGVLGVGRNASDDEIKSAFRKLARETHPDLNSGIKEGDPKYEAWIRANEAYSVLSDSKKREKYDAAGIGGGEAESNNGSRGDRGRTDTYTVDTSGEVSFEQSFNNATGTFFPSGYNWMTGKVEQPVRNSRPQSFQSKARTTTREDKKVDEVYLPQNDLGLLAALVEAYSSDTDIDLKVSNSSLDKRPWMPEYLYEVKKTDGHVEIYRSIKDWRTEYDREKTIAFYPKESEGMEVFSKDHLFSEKYLMRLAEGEINGQPRSSVVVLGGYDDYQGAIKSYARKLSDGRTDYESELNIISAFTRNNWKCNVEGDKARSSWEGNENAFRYRADTLPELIKDAGVLVVNVERSSRTVEGSGKIG